MAWPIQCINLRERSIRFLGALMPGAIRNLICVGLCLGILGSPFPAQAKVSERIGKMIKAIFKHRSDDSEQEDETDPNIPAPPPTHNFAPKNISADRNNLNNAQNQSELKPLRERTNHNLPEDEEDSFCGDAAYESICGDADDGLAQFQKQLKKEFRKAQLAAIPDEKGKTISVEELDARLAVINTPNANHEYEVPKQWQDWYLRYLQSVTPKSDLRELVANQTDSVIQGILAEAQFSNRWEPDLEKRLKATFSKIKVHFEPDAHLIADRTLFNKWIMACNQSGNGDNGFAKDSDIYMCPGRALAAALRTDGSAGMIEVDYDGSIAHEAGHLAALATPSQDSCITKRYSKVKDAKILKSLTNETKADFRAAWATGMNLAKGYTHDLSAKDYVKSVLQPFCGKNGKTHPLAIDRIVGFIRVLRAIPATPEGPAPRELLGCGGLKPSEKICTTDGEYPI